MFYSFLFQGDRGFEGPRGLRGIPGVGVKGDKVRNPLTLRMKCRLYHRK